MRQAIAEAEQIVEMPQPDVALHRVIFRGLSEWSSAGLSQHLATFATCSAVGADSVCVWSLGLPPRPSIEVWCVVRSQGEGEGDIDPDDCVVYQRGKASRP